MHLSVYNRLACYKMKVTLQLYPKTDAAKTSKYLTIGKLHERFTSRQHEDVVIASLY